ncbi:MAG: Cytochrome c-type biogenesis protein CcmF [Desulfovibrio sp.]
MPFFAFSLLLFCFALALLGAILAMPTNRTAKTSRPTFMEGINLAIFAVFTLCCFILTVALVSSNFSFLYAVFNSDRDLHLFYRVTGLWAGQEGALLFWAWCVSLCAVAFQYSKGYREMDATAKRWYWSVFFTIIAFFCLLLTSWNNPFLSADPVPADGYGMNPMLQNPGMIFHPPLLFLGYGAFTIPCCAALGALLSLKENTAPVMWARLTRPFILWGWLLLSAGIILGGWWSYMELGWGGYWAWDPVENASLVPWLVATAYLHTALVENAREKLHRTNAFLMALVTISAFFATYLVRGGIVRSVHAFGQSDVGMPLLVFVLLFLLFAILAACFAPSKGKPLENPLSREGLLTLTAWVFLTLAVIIILGTLWPVISRIWSAKPVGLSPAFYNTVCLPLFVLLMFFLAACPWTQWRGGLRNKGGLLYVVLTGVAAAAVLGYVGFTKAVPLAGMAVSIAVIAGSCMFFAVTPGLLRVKPTLAAHGVHAAFALMVIGTAFSGPYKVQEDFVLQPGQSAIFGDYSLRLASVKQGDSHDAQGGPHPDHAANPPLYIYAEAVLEVTKNGERIGELRPQMRRYKSHPDQAFSEVDTLFSFGNELYCSFVGIDGTRATATVQVSVNPLVNWIWVGGTLLCLFPLAGLRARTMRDAANREEEA